MDVTMDATKSPGQESSRVNAYNIASPKWESHGTGMTDGDKALPA